MINANKRLHYIATVTIMSVVMFISSSCNNTSIHQELNRLDKLSDSDPTLALKHLDSLTQFIANERNDVKMHYQLISVKALDKDYRPFTSDTLIRSIIDYYEPRISDPLRPLALYYGGRVYYELGDFPRALEYYQQAAEALRNDNSPKAIKQIQLIHSQTGVLFANLYLFDKALTEFKKSYALSQQLNDSVSMTIGLCDIGAMYLNLDSIDSAEIFYSEANNISLKLKNPNLLSRVSSQRMNFYYSTKKYLIADSILNASKFFLKNSYNKSFHYSILSYLHYNAGRIDSAVYYAKWLVDSGLPTAKKDANIIMAHVYSTQKDSGNALKYLMNYDHLIDSLSRLKNARYVTQMNAAYNYSIYERENQALKQERLRTKWVTAFWFIFAFAILLSAIALYYYMRNKQNLLRLDRDRYQKLITELQLKQTADIADREARLATLQLKLTNALNSTNEVKKSLTDQIKLLTQQLSELSHQHDHAISIVESSPIKARFIDIATNPRLKPTPNDWHELSKLINEAYPGFTETLLSLKSLKHIHVRLSLMLKMKLSQKDIASILGLKDSAVGMLRLRLSRRYTENNTAKGWDDFITSL